MFRLAIAPHSALKIGANSTIKIGLKFCVCGAEIENRPNTERSVLRSANRVSDDPACSNKVQNTVLKVMSTIAAHIIWNSAFVPLA